MSSSTTCALLALLISAGCTKASNTERDADKAQDKADEKIYDAKVKADQEIRDARAEADVEIAGAQADFTTLRESYRHETSLKLVELDRKIAEVEARVLRANGPEKITQETNLSRIRADRASFLQDYQELDKVTGATWDATRTRLDREWDELSRLVNES